MNKKLILISIATVVANKIFGQPNLDYISSNSNTIILLTWIIAIVALVLAVVNTFKIAYNKKIREVNLVNQKDDLNVSMDAIKVTLSKDIRGIKRDISKIERKTKNPQPNQPKAKNEDSKEPQITEDQPNEKKQVKRPFKKRKPFYKRQAAKKDNQNNEQ